MECDEEAGRWGYAPEQSLPVYAAGKMAVSPFVSPNFGIGVSPRKDCLSGLMVGVLVNSLWA